MAVTLSDEQYNAFIKNGYTDDDIGATIKRQRFEGMPDSAIYTAMNKKYREIAGIKDVVTPQMGDQPNYDAILNNPALQPQQQAKQIQEQGEAYRAGLDQNLMLQKGRIGAGSLISGAGLLPVFGVSGVPSAIGGAMYGAGQAIAKGEKLPEILKETAGGAAAGYIVPKALSKGGELISPLVAPLASKIGNTKVAQAIGKVLTKEYQAPEALENLIKFGSAPQRAMSGIEVPPSVQELGELATNPQAYVAKTGRPVGLSRLPKDVPLAEVPTVGEAPTQQLAPNKFAIEADTDVPITQVEQPSVSAINQPMPKAIENDVLYTPQGTEVIKNPTPNQFRELTKRFDKENPVNPYNDPKTRRTYDEQGNEYVWVSSDNVHGFVEPHLEQVTGSKMNQDIGTLNHQKARDLGVPLSSLSDYRNAVENGYRGTFESYVSKEIKPQANVPEMVQPQVPVPQGQVKTRGGIKTIGKGFGEDVANQVTDRTYETRGLARNEAEFANLTPEQQIDLVNTDDISDLSIYAKQENLKARLNAGELPQRDLNKYVKQGTQQGQAFQARAAENINTPLGALTATQSVIRKATPKRINDIIDNADNIVDAVTTARTSVAKVTNLENALKGTVKGERKYLVDRILKLEADGQLDADNVIKLVNKKYNIPEITQPDLDKIQELTGKISSATTERESEVAKGLLRKFMVDKVPKTVRNKVNTYRYINMLLSPKSRSKDFIFTAAFQGEQAIDEVFAQLPALASKVFKGINTRGGLQPKAWVGGLKKGFREGAEDVRLGIETGRAGEGTRYDLPRGQQFAYTPLKDIGVEPNVIKKIAMAGENVLSKLEKALNYTIRVPDRMFYEAKYASSVADQIKAGGVKEPTSEMIEQAVKEAKDAVYQGDTWIGKISDDIRNGLNKIPLGPIKVGDLEIPFVKTVANIAEEGLKNIGGLPVGMTKWGIAKTPAELRDAELLIGKGLKSLGYLGVGGGIAAGAIKSNIGDLSLTGKDRDAVTGMQPQSIAIGNKSFSLANAPNVTIPIAIYASLLKQGTPQERAGRAALTAMSALGDMPAFKSVGDLFEGGSEILSNMADDDTKGAIDAATQMGNQQIANVTGQFVPLTGAMGNIRNIVDPSSREQYTQDLGQYIGNKTINRIPFASQSLPQRYGITGEPVMTTNIQNPIARTVGELVDPFSVRNYTPNSTIDTMSNLVKQSKGIEGNKAFNIKKAKRSIDINGVRTKLSPKEYSAYQKDYGKINYFMRQKAMKSKTWKMANNEERVKYMRNLNSSIDQAVKSVLFNHSPKKQEKYTQEIIDNYDTFTK